MNKGIPRLRMFAGPNGSGKSTFKSIIRPELLGIYINPDEIEKEICDRGFLDLQFCSADIYKSISFLQILSASLKIFFVSKLCGFHQQMSLHY